LQHSVALIINFEARKENKKLSSSTSTHFTEVTRQKSFRVNPFYDYFMETVGSLSLLQSKKEFMSD
jgi:hypothetical protein